jgi:hypothetical protein
LSSGIAARLAADEQRIVKVLKTSIKSSVLLQRSYLEHTENPLRFAISNLPT